MTFGGACSRQGRGGVGHFGHQSGARRSRRRGKDTRQLRAESGAARQGAQRRRQRQSKNRTGLRVCLLSNQARSYIGTRGAVPSPDGCFAPKRPTCIFFYIFIFHHITNFIRRPNVSYLLNYYDVSILDNCS